MAFIGFSQLRQYGGPGCVVAYPLDTVDRRVRVCSSVEQVGPVRFTPAMRQSAAQQISSDISFKRSQIDQCHSPVVIPVSENALAESSTIASRQSLAAARSKTANCCSRSPAHFRLRAQPAPFSNGIRRAARNGCHGAEL